MKLNWHHFWAPALCLALSLVGTSVHAQQQQKLRNAVAGPLKEARELIQNKSYQDALAQIDEAEQVGKLTEYERSVILRMRSAAAIGAGQTGLAFTAYEQLLQTDQVTPEERPQLVEVAARLAYGENEYAKAAKYLSEYQTLGGNKPDILDLLPQAYYLVEDCANASSAIKLRIAAYEQAGAPPSKTLLQLLTSCALKDNDMQGYAEGMAYLVRYHPTAEYWLDLIARTVSQPGFPQQQLALDIYRLRKATGTMSQDSDYMEAAQLALQAGYPGEAQAFIDEGYSRGLLGDGPEAARQQGVKTQIAGKLAEDRKTLDAGVAEAQKQAGGDALVAMGMNYAGYGDYTRAIDLMRQGIAKGKLRNPDLTQVHFGVVLLQSGDVAQATQVLGQVKDVGGAKALAQLWSLAASAKR